MHWLVGSCMPELPRLRMQAPEDILQAQGLLEG